MHIGGEARVGLCFDVDIMKLARGAYKDRIIVFLNLHAHFRELCAHAFHVLGDHRFDQNLTACCRRRDHEGSRLDHIGNDRIITAV